MLYLESLQKTPPLEDENLDFEDDIGGDIRSDVQEGSNVARTIPIQTTGVVSRLRDDALEHRLTLAQPEREPGPNDPPGPKFESFGSSFGNFGPLPPGDGFGIYGQVCRTVLHATCSDVLKNTPPKPPAPVPMPASPSSSHPNPFQARAFSLLVRASVSPTSVSYSNSV